MKFSKDSAILSYLLSLSEKQLDEIQQTSDAIGESKKELEKVLVSQEDEEMYAEMEKQTNKELEDLEKKENQKKLHMSEEDTTKKEKVSRIRLRDQGRKIPMGKLAGRDQRMSQGEEKERVITPTSRIVITNIQGPKNRMERVWRNPSEEDKEKSKKLWETDPAAEADPTVANKRVRFGFARTVEYSPIEG